MKDQIFNFGRFEERKENDFQRSFKLEIYAVGVDVESALHSLGKAIGWGKITQIEFQLDTCNKPCEWYVRFRAEGTSMKASGEFVTGGVIVTWWK